MSSQLTIPLSNQSRPWRAICAKFSPDASSIMPLVLLLLAGHLFLWTVLTAISHRSPGLDNIEQLVWGNNFEWGYYKHPPMPAWWLYGLTSLFGRHVWVTFFAGQLSVVLSFYFIFRLGCEMTSQKNALIAMLVITPITYFTIGGVMCNHNTVQLCSIAACLWMFYRVWRYERILDWGILGFCCGLAMLTKYSAVIQFAVFFLFLLYVGRLRQARTWKGIAIASSVFLVTLTPHLIWLITQVTQGTQAHTPIGYATGAIFQEMSRLEQLELVAHVLATSLARLAPMGLGLILITLILHRQQKKRHLTVVPVTKKAQELSSLDRLFILFVGLGPFLLTFATVLVLKVRIIADWGTTFYLLFGFLTFWLLRSDNSTGLLRTCLTVIILLQIIMALSYALARGPLADMTGSRTRSTFPGDAVSALLETKWNENVHTPLSLVAADVWLGGNIAVHARHKVNVLIDGDIDESPWVTKEAKCGMLVAINRSPRAAEGASPEVVHLMSEAAIKGTIQLPWTKKKQGQQVIIDYGIIKPLPSCPSYQP